MKKLLVAVFLLSSSTAVRADASCYGKFPNLITDICWSCMFPIKIFGGMTLVSDGQEDYDTGANAAVCWCSTPPKVGIPVSFWEYARVAEVTRTPYCLVTLGGVQASIDINSDSYGAITQPDTTLMGMEGYSSTRHVHWYINPIMYLLQIILDNACIENQQFDLAYLSEVDPTHLDDELEGLMSPDAFLFGGMVAQAACAADCVSATAGFPLSELFWCGGCNGSLYPLSGSVQAHIGGVQASSLLIQRVAAKLHRAGTQYSAAGTAGMCGYYPQIIMDKRQYKYTMTYPIPQTAKIAGKCCQPMGRTTILWGSGREYPVEGEDFAYAILRRRDCCQGIFP